MLAAQQRRYEVYCDESRPELFVAAGARTGNSVIGSLWMPAEFRATFKRDIAALRATHDVWGEFKWNKVSPSALPFYRALVDYFFSSDALSFRAICVDAGLLDLKRFHDSNPELGFYKFYYQLLTHWIDPMGTYAVYCDDKVNRDKQRLPVLRRVLENSNRDASIPTLQALDSHQVVAIQLCDVLVGVTQRRANGSAGTSIAKETVARDVEAHVGHRLKPTLPSERKFNIFQIRLQGGKQ